MFEWLFKNNKKKTNVEKDDSLKKEVKVQDINFVIEQSINLDNKDNELVSVVCEKLYIDKDNEKVESIKNETFEKEQLTSGVDNDFSVKSSEHNTEDIHIDSSLERNVKLVQFVQVVREYTMKITERNEEMLIFDKYSKLKLIEEKTEKYINGFYNVREYNSRVFVKQAEHLANLTDNYKHIAVYNIPFTRFETMDKPLYVDMNLEQFRTYITWRTSVENKKYYDVDLPYVLLYLYEIINLKRTIDTTEGFEKFIFIWSNFRKVNKFVDYLFYQWGHDYIVYYRCTPILFEKLNQVYNYEGQLWQTNLYRLYDKLKNKEFTNLASLLDSKSKDYNLFKREFFNSKWGYTIDEVLTIVMSKICEHEEYESIVALLAGEHCEGHWFPFSNAVFVNQQRYDEDFFVMKNERIHYWYKNNEWYVRVQNMRLFSRDFVIALLKNIEYYLRKYIGFKSNFRLQQIDEVKTIDINQIIESSAINYCTINQLVDAYKKIPTLNPIEINHKIANEMNLENDSVVAKKQDILSDLNDNQKDAVMSTEGYVRVIAGAGSGKTKTLANRYAYLVKHMGISTESILCVTFTNKAAQEMKNRVKMLLGNEYGNFLIYTYHGFCTYILREDIHHLFYPKNFIILDAEDQKAIIREIYGELNLKLNDKTFREILDYIRLTKGSLGNQYVEILVNRATINIETSSDMYEKIFYMYLQKERKNYGLDFDDLMHFVFYLFDNFNDSKIKWQKRLEYIQVDEFQDNNMKQYSFVSLLSEYHKNLFVVGDPDQTIYTWRGARPELIVNFNKDFSDVKTVILDLNYRSLQKILDVSNSLINKNKIRIDKDLTAYRKSETSVIHYHAKNEYDEAEWIVKKIKSLLSLGVKYSDFAILYRANYQSRIIEQKFMQESLNYIIYGGIKFYERKEIKDVLSYLRLLTNEDDLSFLRVVNEPTRKIGKVKINYIKDKANSLKISLYDSLKDSLDEKMFVGTGARNFISTVEKYKGEMRKLTLTELTKQFIEGSGYERMIREDGDQERLDNLQELYNSMLLFERDYGEEFPLEDYLSQVSLYTDIDRSDNKEKTKLMTVHTAKGLEFKHVFVYGMNEGIMPSTKSLTPAKLEEERRIAYVAMTRAKDGLYLTESEGFNHNGQKYPSRFLFELDRSKLIVEGDFDANKNYWEYTYKNLEQQDIPILSINQNVSHPIFGKGVITKVDTDNKKYEILFPKDNKTRSIMFNQKILENK